MSSGPQPKRFAPVFYSASGLVTVNPFVRPSDSVTRSHCLNDLTYDAVSLEDKPHDSYFFTVNFSAKFQREYTELGRRIREG